MYFFALLHPLILILTVILKESAKKCSESICKNVLTEDDWKIGKTKVFLKVLR